ncbi:SusC/RagA family TonB-linked outer membrane protein [Aquimarina celericrescens]|uniref:SusC/RagA family TonB-linked outer membrane protein n=1 Tax=Aquimarina celericrescens TaxID=1964542 RepID=A0ABW5B3E7_9FLAO|nr:SusC/RagA family TonB-linked outer membrane protein [Aquimarina celericrescens]
MRKQLLILMLTIILTSFGHAQTTVTGTVQDANGPLPGASIVVKGTSKGTITDFDGNYSIEAGNDDTLIFSYLGFITQEIPVSSKTKIDIVLQEDAESLDEVIVTSLGFVEKRDKLSSTYSKIDADKLVQPVENKIIDGIAGKAAGVNISATSGDPGAGSNIQIRGASSLGGSSQPLIIVDGIPLNNDTLEGSGSGDTSAGVSQQSRLNDLNPDDIESFQVFKGASAGALYGTRALNGVIVITTKKGKKGKMSVTFTSGVSIDEVSYKHPLQQSFGQGINGSYSPTSAFSWGDRISDRSGAADEVDTSGQFFESLVSDNVIYPIIQRNQREQFVDSNFDKVFGTGITLDNRFTISTGNEKGTYFLSGGHVDQEGTIKNSFYKKTNFTLNTSQKFTEKLTANIKGNYVHTGSNRIQQGSNTAGLYLGLLRTSPDFDITDYIGDYNDGSGTIVQSRHRSYRRYLGNSDNPIYNNPLWTINEQESTATVNRFIGTAELQYQWNDHVSSILRGGADFYTDNRVYFFPYYTASAARRYGLLNDETIHNQEYTMDILTSFRYQLTKKLNTNVILGYGINDRRRKRDFIEADNFIANFRKPLDPAEISAKENITAEVTRTSRRNIRFYGTANFDYADQLILTVGGAYEKHSVLPKSDNAFFYPSVELGWTFSKIIEGFDALSFGKIRLAYGQVGNVPLAHREQTVFEVGSFSSFSDNIALEDFGGGFQFDERLGNPNLKPEIKTEYEAGVDLRFFQNRVSLSTTYYQNETTDVLLDIAIPPSLGFSEIYGNGATIENEGFEVELKYDFIKNKNWNASAAINFSTNENLVSKLQGGGVVNFTPGSSIQSVAIEGQPLGVLYTQGALRNDDGSLVLDANGFPIVDTGGNLVVGDPNPDWLGGIQLTASYKNLSIAALVDTSQGNDLAQRTRFITSYFGTHSDVGNTITLSENLVNYDGDVIPAGTTVRANVGNFGNGNVLLDESYYRTLYGFGDGKLNEFAVQDGSWTRLRELSLSYVLNSDSLRKNIGLNSIEFTASGRNLVIWTDVVGIDPDVNQFGVGRGRGLDYFSNPGVRTYAFSVKFNY